MSTPKRLLLHTPPTTRFIRTRRLEGASIRKLVHAVDGLLGTDRPDDITLQ